MIPMKFCGRKLLPSQNLTDLIALEAYHSSRGSYLNGRDMGVGKATAMYIIALHQHIMNVQ